MADEEKEKNYLKSLLEKTKLKDVMIKPAIVILENDQLSQAHMKFTDSRVSHLLVVNPSNKLVGLISPKYLYKTHSPKKRMSDDINYSSDIILDGDSYFSKESLDKYILRQIMHKDPFVLSPDDSIFEALIQMSRRNVSCIPIVSEDHEAVGTLTNQEVINFITKPFI